MRKAAIFVFLLAVGLTVFFAGYWAGMPHWLPKVSKLVVPCLLLAATIVCRSKESLSQWYSVSLAFLAASSAFVVAGWVSDPLMRLFGITANSVSGVAVAKFFDAFPIVVTILVVSHLGGLRPADLFLQKGRLKAGLLVGLITFAAFTGLFLLQARSQSLGVDRLLANAPWTLLFVFSNAFTEELHFRGLLLKPFERLLGGHPANVCVALIFTLVHAPVGYAPDILVFLAITFVLALAWGYVMQKTGAMWGSVLFHAGADLMIIVSIYKIYGGG